MDQPGRSTARRTLVISVAALACLSAACGDPDGEASAGRTPSTTATTATTAASAGTASTPPASTTTTVPELPPCDPAAGFRQVTSDWLPVTTPPGWEIVYGGTQVYGREPQADALQRWAFSLVERLEGNRLGLTLSVGAAVETGDHQQALAPDEPVLSTVRGRPGTVGRWINRGDSVGVRMARWEEGGLHWSASTASDSLTNEELVAVLDRLELSRDGASDPTGALTLLGRSRSAPPTSTDRYTRVVFRRAGAQVNEQVQIDADPPVEGLEGILDPVGDRVLETDRGILVSDGRTASARQPDGLGLHLMAVDMTGQVSATPLSMTDLEALLLTPWARVAPDDSRRRTVALMDPDYSAETPDFCRE